MTPNAAQISLTCVKIKQSGGNKTLYLKCDTIWKEYTVYVMIDLVFYFSHCVLSCLSSPVDVLIELLKSTWPASTAVYLLMSNGIYIFCSRDHFSLCYAFVPHSLLLSRCSGVMCMISRLSLSKLWEWTVLFLKPQSTKRVCLGFCINATTNVTGSDLFVHKQRTKQQSASTRASEHKQSQEPWSKEQNWYFTDYSIISIFLFIININRKA